MEEVRRRPVVEGACPGLEAQASFGPDLANIWVGLEVSEACPGLEAAEAASFWEIRYGDKAIVAV